MALIFHEGYLALARALKICDASDVNSAVTLDLPTYVRGQLGDRHLSIFLAHKLCLRSLNRSLED
jgi:hypothetical protein